MKTSKVLNVLWDYFLMSVGTLIFVMAWTSFLQPNNLASGGLTGLSTILDYATQGMIPMDVTYALLNVLLLVAGFLFLGRAFGFKTIYVIALSSLLFCRSISLIWKLSILSWTRLWWCSSEVRWSPSASV